MLLAVWVWAVAIAAVIAFQVIPWSFFVPSGALSLLSSVFGLFGLTFGVGLLAISDVSSFTLRLFHWVRHTVWRRCVAHLFEVSAIAGAALVAWILLSNAVIANFQYRLDEAARPQNSAQAELMAMNLFCDYPERVEARALLASYLVQIRGEPEAQSKAYERVLGETTPEPGLKGIDGERFLSECIAPNRLLPHFTQDSEVARDSARIFYAALFFHVIRNPQEYERRMAWMSSSE